MYYTNSIATAPYWFTILVIITMAFALFAVQKCQQALRLCNLPFDTWNVHQHKRYMVALHGIVISMFTFVLLGSIYGPSANVHYMHVLWKTNWVGNVLIGLFIVAACINVFVALFSVMFAVHVYRYPVILAKRVRKNRRYPMPGLEFTQNVRNRKSHRQAGVSATYLAWNGRELVNRLYRP